MMLGFKYSMLNHFVQDRLDNDRDAKIIVTARNSSTGTGKTTLALLLAKYWDRNGWDYDKGFMGVKKYLAYYNNVAERGDVLLLDDAQAGVDNRRSMSKENVGVSRAWTLNRVKNVVSIMTLPTSTMFDSRLRELADVWINVQERGRAVPYKIYVNDISKEIKVVRFRHPYIGYKEVINFKKYVDNDYLELSKQKQEYVNREWERIFEDDWRELLDMDVD